jgi:hypothetical protein
MQIISGRVVFARTVQPAQYESKRAEVELSFVLAEGDDVGMAVELASHEAMSAVLQMVGLKPGLNPLEKPKQMPPKPVTTEAPKTETASPTAAPDEVPSVPTTITAEQLNQLNTLIIATDTDVDKLMEHLGHKGTELHSLPADKFEAALAALKAKRERMEAAGQAGTSDATQTAPQQENAPAASARKPRADAGVPRGPRTRKDGDVVANAHAGSVDTPAAQEQSPPERPEQFPEPYIMQSTEAYVKYVERWIKEMGTDAAGMIKRWNNERDMRNSLAESVPAGELTRLRSLIGTSSGADRKVAS